MAIPRVFPVLAALTICAAAHAAPADWLARIDPPSTAVVAARPFRATYRITWSGVTAARVEVVSALPPEGNEVRTVLKTATAGMARSLWQMDATHLAIADRRTQRPVRIEESDKREKKEITSRVEFSPEGATRTTRTVRKGETPEAVKPKRFDYADLLDMHSALLNLRNLALANGENHALLVMTVTNPYVVSFKVIGRETVEVKAGKRAAIKCSLSLSKVNKDGELVPQKKFKSAAVWIADDADRALLKVEAKVFVGSVVLELEQLAYSDEPGR